MIEPNGSIKVFEQKDHPDISLVYRVEFTNKTPLTFKEADVLKEKLERLINCGNLN